MAASTTVLPPLTCTARGQLHRLAAVVFLLRDRPTVGRLLLRPVPGGESAGCVRLQWLVLRAVCLLFTLCLPCPLPFIRSCPHSTVCFAPVQFALFACTLFISMCARIISVRASSLSGPAVCKLQELSRWQLQHGPAVAARAPVHLTPSFPCRVHDPGPWV